MGVAKSFNQGKKTFLERGVVITVHETYLCTGLLSRGILTGRGRPNVIIYLLFLILPNGQHKYIIENFSICTILLFDSLPP